MDDEYMLYTYKVRPCDRKVRAVSPWKLGQQLMHHQGQGSVSCQLDFFHNPSQH
jgi:hypothetical protein